MSGIENLSLYQKVQLLSTVDRGTFNKLCNLNREYSEICNGTLPPSIVKRYGTLTETMYENRVKKFFDDDIQKFAEPGMTWREFYQRISKMYEEFEKNILSNTVYMDILLENYCKENKLMELKIMSNIKRPNGRGVFPTPEVALYYAVVNNNVDLLKWLISEEIMPEKIDYDNALAKGKQDIVNIILSTNPNFTPDIDTAYYALQEGNLELLKTLYSDYGLIMNGQSLDDIIFELDNTEKILDIFKWHASIPPPDGPILPTFRAADNALRIENIDILEWLSEQNRPIYPKFEDIDLSELKNYTIRWLQSKELIFEI